MTAGLQETVVVTGASSGIGEATARELAARGAAVALVARRADRLTALAARIAAAGGTAQVVEADVRDQRQVRDAVEKTARAWGRLDILINNAGVARSGPFADATVLDWEHMVQLNLLGSLYCAHAALPHLLRAAMDGPREVADLVNVSSLSGRTVRKGSAVYNATKHAMNAYSESLRQEVAGCGCRYWSRPRWRPSCFHARSGTDAWRRPTIRHCEPRTSPTPSVTPSPAQSCRGERTADPAHWPGTLKPATRDTGWTRHYLPGRLTT